MLGHSRFLAVCSTALVSTAALAQAPPAPPPSGAQSSSVFDLSQLPATKGTIQQFTLTPRGDIDGLILTDGTEVKLPPHLTPEITAAMKVGDAVTVRGLRAAALPLIAASSVTNDTSGAVVTDTGGRGPGAKGRGYGFLGFGAPAEPASAELQGRVKMTLHGRMGEVNGALLDDGTVLRLPPPEAARLENLLAPGQSIAVRGDMRSTSLGKVVAVRAIGPSQDKLSEVQGPPPGGKRHGEASAQGLTRLSSDPGTSRPTPRSPHDVKHPTERK